MRAIIEGSVSETGGEFFCSLVTHLTSTLPVQYAVIGEVLEGRLRKIRTRAVSAGDTLVDNFENVRILTTWGTQLSAETLDVGLSVRPRGPLRSALLPALRQARTARRPRARGTDRRGQIPQMTPMAERPAEVATRTVLGYWEGDLIKGVRQWLGRCRSRC